MGGELEQGLPEGGGHGHQAVGETMGQQAVPRAQRGGIAARVSAVTSRNDASTIEQELDWQEERLQGPSPESEHIQGFCVHERKITRGAHGTFN